MVPGNSGLKLWVDCSVSHHCFCSAVRCICPLPPDAWCLPVARLSPVTAGTTFVLPRYSRFVAVISLAFIGSDLLCFQGWLQLLDYAGLCALTVVHLAYFAAFAPVVYVTLKEDSM